MGWMELMIVGVVALIVVGPKDLPVMFQTLGKMTAKVKRMAREFSGAMNDAANATGAQDIAKDLKGLTNPKAFGMDKLKEVADDFDKWEPGKEPKVAGSETAKLRAERAEQVRKVKDSMAKKGQEKLDRAKAEAGATDDAASAPDTAAKPTPKPKTTRAAKAKSTTVAKPKPAAKPKATSAAKTKPAAKPKPKPKAKPKPNTDAS